MYRSQERRARGDHSLPYIRRLYRAAIAEVVAAYGSLRSLDASANYSRLTVWNVVRPGEAYEIESRDKSSGVIWDPMGGW